MSILLPLYIYPQAGAWNPLYTAARTHPDVDFTVIINPCSGPCNASLPEKAYLDEIPKLNAFSNIRTLGYVATNYTTKELSRVQREIDTYAQWPRAANDSRIRVDGIFFDETPAAYEEEKYTYLRLASEAVRNRTRFRDGFVVHNPGLLPPSLLTSPTLPSTSYLNLSDITVVFEEAFMKWLDAPTFDGLRAHQLRTARLAVILHSVPNLSKSVLEFVVRGVEEVADWVFLTGEGDYRGFSGWFEGLVGSVGGG